MSANYQLLEQYLLPCSDGFWEWRDGGEVIAWRNGQTIAFRGELVAVLRRLAPFGLPPVDALLLVLAATRSNCKEFDGQSGFFHSICRELTNSVDLDAITAVMHGLRSVHWLPEELRVSPAAKAVLAECLFEDTDPVAPPAQAQAIVAALEQAPAERFITSEVQIYGAKESLRRSFRDLQFALRRVDESRLRMRAETGLDSVVEPVEEVLPDSQQVRALLAQLSDDAELRGLAAIARDLMAAVTLPRAISSHDDLPVGGVSDITNRGPLDRLVASELAHDDLTLAVRVALGEALYYRRESPPRPRTQTRSILIDAGIRAWGIPRVLATGVALALAATASRSSQLSAFRARRGEVDRVDLKSRDGLMTHLAALTVDPHPGEALDAFAVETQPDPRSSAETIAERIVIMTEESYDDADFRQTLVESTAAAPMFVATVNRQGRLRLLTANARGQKMLRETRIDVTKLLADDVRDSVPFVDPGADLPAIFSVEPFPLRLSHPDAPKRSWILTPSSSRVFRKLVVLSDGRVLLWDDTDLGALQLGLDAPRGELIWNSADRWSDRALAVVKQGKPDNFHVLNIDAFHQFVRSQRLDLDKQPKAFVPLAERLLAVFGTSLMLFDVTTGAMVYGVLIPPEMQWHSGRYFVSRSNASAWHVVVYDGLGLRFHEVGTNGPPLIAVFDGPGGRGPVGLLTSGNLYDFESQQTRMARLPFEGPYRCLGVHAGRVYLESVRGIGKFAVIDLKTLAVSDTVTGKLLPQTDSRHQHRPIRHQVRSMDVDADDNLILRFGRSAVVIKCDVFAPAVRLASIEDDGTERKLRQLKHVKLPSSMGISLRVATWDDGSRAYVDSRGLLHLRSSDSSVPQLTLTLTEDKLAGWTAEGGAFGPRFYTGNGKADTAHDILQIQRILHEFTRRLR